MDGDFNMAAEIRGLLTQNPKLTGREVEAAIRKKFPRRKFNSSSCQVAFSIARKQLGLRLPKTMRSYSDDQEVNLLFNAKQYVDQCGGDVDRAFAGLKELASLQLPKSNPSPT